MKTVTLHELNLWVIKSAAGAKIGTRDPPIFSPEGVHMIYETRKNYPTCGAAIRETISQIGATLRNKLGIPDPSGDHLTPEDAARVAQAMGFPDAVPDASAVPAPRPGPKGPRGLDDDTTPTSKPVLERRKERLIQWLEGLKIPREMWLRLGDLSYSLLSIYEALKPYPEFRSTTGRGDPITCNTFKREFWREQPIAKIGDGRG